MALPVPTLDWPNPRGRVSVVAQTSQSLGPTQPVSTLPPFAQLDWPAPRKYTELWRTRAQIALDAQELGPTRPLPKTARLATISPVPHNAKQPAFDTWLTQIARTWNLALQGKMNAVAQVVLLPGQTSTSLADSRIGQFSHIELSPLSASAATILATGQVWFTPTTGSVTINHPVSGDFDMLCSVLIIG